MRKHKHGKFTGQQIIIATIALVVLASTGLLGAMIELVVGLTLGAVGLLMGLIGLAVGLVAGVIGLVIGLLPVIVVLAIVTAILKNTNHNESKRKNDFV